MDGGDLRAELLETRALLRNLRRETARFLSETSSDSSPTRKQPTRVEKGAGSAWARSGSARGARSGPTSNDRPLQVVQAEHRTKTSAPSYSFPRAARAPSHPESPPLSAISPRVDALSSRKRTPSVRIVPETRKAAKTESHAPQALEEKTDLARPSDPDVGSQRAFSFPRSRRFSDREEEGLGPLDVEAGLLLTRPRTPSAIIPKLVEPHQPVDESTEVDDEDRDPAAADAHQSHRPRVPTIQMTTKRSRSRIPLRSFTPPPGKYDPSPSFGSISRRGRVYHSEHCLRVSAKVAMARGNPHAKLYDTTAAEEYLRTVPKVHLSATSESKVSDHLLRKRYWEEKARVAREDHDDCREANQDLVRPRTPIVIMRADEKDSRRRDPVRSIVDEIEEMIGEDSLEQLKLPQGDVNYSAIEKRTKCHVRMSSTSARDAILRSRPEVLAVVAQREKEDARSRRLYGPQLQVPWGSRDDQRSHIICESPTKYVSKAFAFGMRRSHSEPDLANAYMRSSLVGVNRSSFRFRKETRKPKEVADTRDFIGPQTIRDWVKDASSSNLRLHAIDYDLNKGRESMAVGAKGQRQIVHFNEAPQPLDGLGPGAYEKSAVFGSDAKGVAFSKLSRDVDDGASLHESERLDLDVDRAHEYLDSRVNIKLYAKVIVLLFCFLIQILGSL